ncbi:MAG: hypothetical protein ACYTHM_11180 [Planctomycetota bacterium]|jgi:hypothetical protein
MGTPGTDAEVIVFIIFFILAGVGSIVIVVLGFVKGWFRSPKIDTGNPLDGVRKFKCPFCDERSMEPWFPWWRYFFNVSLPPAFIYVMGRPVEYRCANCNQATKTLGYRRPPALTRISLRHSLPRGFIIAFVVQFLLALLILVLVGRIFSSS